MARDLAAWSELAGTPPIFDVSKARATLHAKLRTTIAEQDTREQKKDLVYAAIRLYKN